MAIDLDVGNGVGRHVALLVLPSRAMRNAGRKQLLAISALSLVGSRFNGACGAGPEQKTARGDA
jgi:hypothetical protein